MSVVSNERIAATAADVVRVARELDIGVEAMTGTLFRANGGSYSNGTWGEILSAAAILDGQSALEDARAGATLTGFHTKGTSTLARDRLGRPVWVKTDRDKERREDVIRRMLETLPTVVSQRSTPVPAPDLTSLDPELLAVWVFGDPHFNMLAWAEETGEADWDLRHAERMWRAAVDAQADQQPRAKRGMVCVLGDLFHADNLDGTTAASGHRLDVDTRLPKAVRVIRDAIVYAVDRALESHATVDLTLIIGNHDPIGSMMLSIGLELYYANEPRVTVDTRPGIFRYFRHGSTLLGITHGHTAKHDDLETIMLADNMGQLDDTTHRYWLCGHIHHSRRQEYRTCIVESFRTLAPSDAWHASKGYRSGRDMSRIVYHTRYGEVARSIVSAEYLAAQTEAA